MMPDADVDHCDDDNEISSLGAREIDNKRAKVKSTKPFDVCVCAKLHLANQIPRSRQKKNSKNDSAPNWILFLFDFIHSSVFLCGSHLSRVFFSHRDII